MFRRCIRLGVAAVVAAATLGIAPAHAAPGLEVGIGDTSVFEGTSGSNRPLSFTVSLSQISLSAVSVTATIAPGTATQGTDYTLSYGITVKTITFKAGQTVKSVSINVRPDADATEGDETLTVTLSNPTAGAALGRSVATGTIVDDDSGPGLGVGVSSASAPEGHADLHKVQAWVTLTSPATTPVTLKVTSASDTATAGSDFVAVTKNLTFNAGQFKKSVVIRILPDVNGEFDEQFTLNLTNVVGATPLNTAAVMVIHNDD